MYTISLGHEGDADCALKINDKEYGVESRAWNLIGFIFESKFEGFKHSPDTQKMLEYIYNNFDEDLINKPVETKQDQKESENPKS